MKPEVNKAPSTPLFKDTVTDLNNVWREAVSHYCIGDTRVGYLRALELCISPCLPGKMLWNFEQYVEMEPMPENPREKVSAGYYLNHLLVMEQIMREGGLIDKEPEQQDVREIPFIDMGGVV